METKHINHVVLYAKNFYRHTNNVVKDMQRFMQLDGHPFYMINTPAKVVKVMRKDFLKWAESFESEYDREHYLEWANGTVAWADGEAGEIHHMLIAYDGHPIPMDSIALDYPKYDQYHLPQFNTIDGGFNSRMSYDQMLARAKEILDETHESRMDRFMNELIDRINWDRLVKAVKVAHDEIVTEEDLQDELWDLYSKFMEDNLDPETHIVKAGCYQLYSKHFAFDINTKNRGVDLSCELICNSIVYKTFGDSDNHIDNVKVLMDMVMNDTVGIESTCAKAMKINTEVEDTFSPCSTNPEDAISCHDDLFKSIKANTTPEVFTEHLGTNWSTGGYNYDIDYNPETNEYTLTLRLVDFFECAIAEEAIRSCGAFISGSKY